MREKVLSRNSSFWTKNKNKRKRKEKQGGREGGRRGQSLPLPFGPISRGCRGIKHIPYNSIRKTSIKAGTLMRRNTTCVRNRHCPLITAPQLAGAAAPRHSRSLNTQGGCCLCRSIDSFPAPSRLLPSSQLTLASSLLTKGNGSVFLTACSLWFCPGLNSSYFAVPFSGINWDARMGQELLTGYRGFGLANQTQPSLLEP